MKKIMFLLFSIGMLNCYSMNNPINDSNQNTSSLIRRKSSNVTESSNMPIKQQERLLH